LGLAIQSAGDPGEDLGLEFWRRFAAHNSVRIAQGFLWQGRGMDAPHGDPDPAVRLAVAVARLKSHFIGPGRTRREDREAKYVWPSQTDIVGTIRALYVDAGLHWHTVDLPRRLRQQQGHGERGDGGLSCAARPGVGQDVVYTQQVTSHSIDALVSQ
jgi:hypothetical protein